MLVNKITSWCYSYYKYMANLALIRQMRDTALSDIYDDSHRELRLIMCEKQQTHSLV